MKLDLILVIGLTVNVLMAVLFPAQIFGDDPLGLQEIKDSKLQEYYDINGTGIITGYDSEGNLISNPDQFTDLQGAVGSTDGNAGLFGLGELLTFIDWVKVGWGLIKSFFMFIIGFIYLLWQMPSPLNFLIGVPFSFLYTFALASFIMGRS